MSCRILYEKVLYFLKQTYNKYFWKELIWFDLKLSCLIWIDFEKKRMLPFIEEGLKLHQDSTMYDISRKKFAQKLTKEKNYCKVRNHCHSPSEYRSAVHSICNLRFNVPTKIDAVFHSGSNFGYHCNIKELETKFKVRFECLGEESENYKRFSFPI